MMNKRLHFGQSLILSAVFAVFVAVVLPLQSYLRNASLYDFTLGELALESAIGCVVLFVFLTGALLLVEWLVGRFLGRFFHVVLLALLACAYLETGVLSIGLPPLNGDITCYQTLTFRKCVDTFTLLGVFCVITGFYKWVKELVHWIALGFLVIFLASLLDVRQECGTRFAEELNGGVCQQCDIVKSVRLSPVRNVIVVVLDAAHGTVAADVAEKDQEIPRLYKGFVAYRNNISMHDCTARGLPGVVTGKYMEKEQSASEYAETIFGQDSLIMPYVHAGLPVYFVPDLFAVGYTNRRLGDIAKPNDKDRPKLAFMRPTKSVPFQSLYDVMEFRLTPTWKKYYVLARIFRRAKATGSNVSLEDNAYPQVASAPLSEELKTTLFFLHTKGMHFMITKDGRGNLLPQGRYDAESVTEYAPYLLKQLGNLFDDFRKKGIYDKSLIIVTADHGNSAFTENPEDPKTLGQYSAMLWVKPIGAQGDFRISNMPTSSSKISKIVKKSIDKDFTEQELEKMLYTEKRLFRGKPGKNGRSLYMIDWIYDADGKVISAEKLGPYYDS